MIDLWNIFIHILPLIAILTFLVRRRYQHWERLGIKGPTPVFPIGYFWQRASTCPKGLELKWLNDFGRTYGVFMGIKPVLTTSDADLIKQVMVKDFHLFVNRRDLQSYHQIWKKNLFFIDGAEDWKRIRSISSPAFTSGKLRKMYPHIQECIAKLKDYLDSVTKDKSGKVLDIKETMVDFTMDVIASTSFGLSTCRYGTDLKTVDPRTANPFNFYGQRFFNSSSFKTILTATLPTWMLRVINLPHQFPVDAFEFFENVSREIIRNKNHQKQTLVGLLKEASVSESELKDMTFNKLTASGETEANSNTVEKKSTDSSMQKYLSEDEIIAQCILFLNAGFETTSSALSNCLFELAKNPAEQERLHDEIVELFSRHEGGGNSTDLSAFYDSIMTDSPYLESCIKETLRMYPTVYRLERRLSADAKGYKLGGIEIEPDQMVEISTVAVHYDPEYYPEPHKFKPSRWLPENKHLLTPYTYLPFGDGPRNCIGMRFAYQELRFCLSHLIKNFKFQPCDSTPEKLDYLINCPILLAKNFNLRVSAR